MKQLEHEEQCALIKWVRLMAKSKPEYQNIFAIPNGGRRHVSVAKKLQAEGVSPGVPDLMLALPNMDYFGLFIEMKSKRGVISDAQQDWMDRLFRAGYDVHVCRSFEEAKTCIEEYLK